ncbi:MAG: N-acetyl-alpha-D-glucosaminyl L-malate synthase [Candidatus Marinimicrobia bacterium]|nr:N-acetyl-alpha-D-glucosaminyl L-malate synthase [Candidatus Neomarinimicrobiota bacterium]
MNIGLVIYGTLDSLTGGYLYDKQIIESLRDAGHEVHIFSQKQRPYPWNIFHNWDRNFREKIAEANLDILLEDELNHPSLFAMNKQIRRQYRIPIIGIVHALRCRSPLSPLSKKFAEMLERKYLNSLDGYIAVSNYIRKHVNALTNSPKMNIVAYPAGDRFGESVTEEEIRKKTEKADPFQLLFVGNIRPNKNLLGVLRALASMELNNAHLTVIGNMNSEASYTREVRQFIANHNLDSQVTFAGQITEPDSIAEYYRNAHLLVLPSYSEGFPLVHAEAAGFGVPSIATSKSGAGEFIDHGVSGYVVEPEDATAIRTFIEKLMRDKQLYKSMSIAALQRYRAHPSWQETGKTVLNFLNQFAPGEKTHG